MLQRSENDSGVLRKRESRALLKDKKNEGYRRVNSWEVINHGVDNNFKTSPPIEKLAENTTPPKVKHQTPVLTPRKIKDFFAGGTDIHRFFLA